MDLKTKIIIILSIFILALCGGGYWLTQKYYSEKQQKEDNAAIIKQNQIAYTDLQKQTADSIQRQAVLIQSLNGKLTEAKLKNGQLTALNTTLQLEIDSIEAHGTGYASSGKDSTGEFGKVRFDGTKGIVDYSGETTYYFNGTAPTYFLDLRFNPIDVVSSFGRDKDDVWRLTTISLTPSIKLRTTSTIDSTIFLALRHMNEKPAPQADIPNFGIRLKLNVGMSSSDIQKNLRAIGWDASAEIYYKYFNVTYYPMTGVVSGGLILDLNLGEYARKIF